MMRLLLTPTSDRSTARPRRRASIRPGFTLVELMIAMAIIVLLIGLALPVFRTINGSRSQEGASNQIAAALARARNDAIGLQTPTGIAFYPDSTGRTVMVEVQAVAPVQWDSTSSPTAAWSRGAYVSDPSSGNWYVASKAIPASTTGTTLGSGSWSTIDTTISSAAGQYLYDQIPEVDTEPLPPGVGVALLNDSSAGVSSIDRYLHVGVILFDLNGRLITQPFGFARNGILGQSSNLASVPLSSPLNIVNNSGTASTGSVSFGGGTTLFSSVGLVVYDAQAAAGQGFPTVDKTITGGTIAAGSTEASEQTWLDTNATPLLVNRYNGTPLRSE